MKEMNRRKFLKIGTLGATAISFGVAFGGVIPVVGMRGRNVSIFTSKFRKGIPTICNICPNRCGVIGFLRYDDLAAIQGNPQHINNQGKICARGIAGVNQVYDPERLLHPQKRVGARGEGKWKKITWNQALTEISNRMQTIKNENRNHEFVFNTDTQNYRGLARRFLNNFENATILTSSALKDSNKTAAQKLTWGEQREVIDAEHCKYFLSFGSNPFESHPYFVSFNQRLAKARINNNAKLISIDPLLSNTAGRSDEWIPIKPGTDGIVALTMANVIVQKGLYDAEFISRWTNVSIARLKTHLSQYTLEKAAGISTIDAATIERIAIEFAANRPAVAFSGSGVAQHVNSFETERSIMLLNALVGNIDKKGGICLPRTYQLNDFSPIEINENEQSTAQFFERVKEDKLKVDFYFAYKNNPVYEYPDCNFTKQVMKDESLMPFTVVMDTVKSETSALADLILPAATFVESWDLDSTPSFEMVPFVSLAQPVMKPRGEALSLNDFFLKLSRRMAESISNSFNFKNVEDYINQSVKQIPGLADEKQFNKLKKQGIWYDTNSEPEYEIYKKQGFATRSRKFEIVRSNVLPKYEPITEHINISKNELFLIPYSTNVMRHDLTNLKWLTEINHANKALINAKTARRLRIEEGDYVILESEIGKIIIKAHITQGIYPGAIAISKGLGHWEYGRIAQSKKFKSEDPDTEFIWWEKDGNGTNPNFVIPISIDPSGKGQAWKDVKVKVNKVS